MTKYIKVLDKRRNLFGIKIEGHKEWLVAPMFEQLGMEEWANETDATWFKRGGKYGYYSITERRVVIPAIYSCPPFFTGKGYAVTWKDYKAGVINIKGETLIPFIYDDIEIRCQNANPDCHGIFCGYACFTNEGGVQAYDSACRPDEFCDWEKEQQSHQPEYANRDTEAMTLEELEDRIRKEYILLLELGYEHPKKWTFSKEHREKIDEQEQTVKSLIRDRKIKMDSSWEHHVENAKRIGRTNKLLMRAVRKAIKLGKKASKSLQWMEKVSNTAHYEVEVYVHPEWQDSRSDLRYERRFKSAAKENDRLIDEEDNLAETHIWNIIATLGGYMKFNGTGSCFEASAYGYKPGYWNERDMIGDEGQSWDECIHYPAYQDEYFTMPFHHLYCDDFIYSFEDLCNINDFRVNVIVHLVTKEQD